MNIPISSSKDADLSLLKAKKVAFIGYGNQGAAQSLNLRDSGISQILIGNRDDAYKDAALADGFEVVTIAEAAARGKIVFLLIPDEEQQQVFRNDIASNLKTGATLVVASGYNVAFKLFDLPSSIDVIMVAPRMIGSGVRQRYLSGEPFPCFISAEQDTSGHALQIAQSIAHAIGATKGVIFSSAREEAALDLFSEQAIWPFIMSAFRAAYKVLHEAGFSDEAILNEMYLSKEPAEVFDRIAEVGLFEQLPLHSHTSQYGQLRALLADDGKWLYEKFKRVLDDDILSGRFAREWSDVQTKGMERLEQMRAVALESDLAKADKKARQTIEQ
jgi:ketol-acid reductoisomerase